MTTLSIQAQVSDPTTGSYIGSLFPFSALLDYTNRETHLVTAVENSFVFSPVVDNEASYLVVHNMGLVNAGDDATSLLNWGYTSSAYDHELGFGESAVVRIRQGSGIAAIFMVSTVSDLWVEAQVWNN